MAKTQKNTAAVVREAIEPVIISLGFEIWDVEYLKEGADWYLRVTIDSPAGVDIEGCERVHRAIDPVLDELDPISEQYMLEVSSPGVERQIRTPEHFTLCIGEQVTLKLFKELNGSKSITGKLTGFNPETKIVKIDSGNGDITVEWDFISRANIYYDFGD